MGLAMMLMGVFIISGLVLIYVINQLWANTGGRTSPALAGNNSNKATK